MRQKINDCGVRNSFGYYDNRAKEIVLKHPCLKKKDVNDVYAWLDSDTELKKIAIGIGAVENCVTDDTGNNLYSAAREVIYQTIAQTAVIDNQILMNILMRLKNKTALRNLACKCYDFSNDDALFEELIRTINTVKSIVYFDLSGCYFKDEQLLCLAEAIAQSHIAHIVWPEPKMSATVEEKVMKIFKGNRSLVVLQGVPASFQKIAEDNRKYLFAQADKPSLIGDKERAIMLEYAESLRLAIAYEKQCLFDLEKAIAAVLA